MNNLLITDIIIMGFVFCEIAWTVVWLLSPTKWGCSAFGWHNGEGERTFDGLSLHSICSNCGKDVMQDSQGNWF